MIKSWIAIIDGKEVTVLDPEGRSLMEMRKVLVRKFGFSRVQGVRANSTGSATDERVHHRAAAADAEQ